MATAAGMALVLPLRAVVGSVAELRRIEAGPVVAREEAVGAAAVHLVRVAVLNPRIRL